MAITNAQKTFITTVAATVVAALIVEYIKKGI